MNENVPGDPGPGHPFPAPFPSCCLAPSCWVISHHQAVGTTKGSPALSSGRGPQGGRGVSSTFDLSLEDPRVLVFCLLFSGKFVQGFREKLQRNATLPQVHCPPFSRSKGKAAGLWGKGPSTQSACRTQVWGQTRGCEWPTVYLAIFSNAFLKTGKAWSLNFFFFFGWNLFSARRQTMGNYNHW